MWWGLLGWFLWIEHKPDFSGIECEVCEGGSEEAACEGEGGESFGAAYR